MVLLLERCGKNGWMMVHPKSKTSPTLASWNWLITLAPLWLCALPMRHLLNKSSEKGQSNCQIELSLHLIAKWKAVEQPVHGLWWLIMLPQPDICFLQLLQLTLRSIEVTGGGKEEELLQLGWTCWGVYLLQLLQLFCDCFRMRIYFSRATSPFAPVVWSHQVDHLTTWRDLSDHVFKIWSCTGSRGMSIFKLLITKWRSDHDLIMNCITSHQLYTGRSSGDLFMNKTIDFTQSLLFSFPASHSSGKSQ